MTESKTSKGKRAMGQSLDETRCMFPSSFPVKLQNLCLIPLATRIDNICEMLSTRKVCQGLSVQGFYKGLVTQTPSAQHVSKFQTPRRKEGSTYNPHSLYEQVRHSEPLLSIRVIRILPQTQVPGNQPVVKLLSRPFKELQSDLLC